MKKGKKSAYQKVKKAIQKSYGSTRQAIGDFSQDLGEGVGTVRRDLARANRPISQVGRNVQQSFRPSIRPAPVNFNPLGMNRAPPQVVGYRIIDGIKYVVLSNGHVVRTV